MKRKRAGRSSACGPSDSIQSLSPRESEERRYWRRLSEDEERKQAPDLRGFRSDEEKG